jgi:hypothetical protein
MALATEPILKRIGWIDTTPLITGGTERSVCFNMIKIKIVLELIYTPMIVYSNSCSYGVMTDGKVYGQVIANRLQADFINKGIPGSCNQRILRNTCKDILELQKLQSPNEVLVLVGLTNTFRDEIWGSKNHHPETHDGHFFSFYSPEEGVKESLFTDYIKQWFTIYDHEAAITNLLHQVSMISTFLKTKGVRYLIWSNSPDLKPIDWKQDFVNAFYNASLSDNNIIPLFEKNFVDYSLSLGHGSFDNVKNPRCGHPESGAHTAWAEFLIDNYLSDLL